MIDKWDERFMQQAVLIASWSKQPSHKVGCVIVDERHSQLVGGFNGFPRGIADDDRMRDRETRLRIVVHAEANAICQAATNGNRLLNATAYTTLPICNRCAILLIQVGISRVVMGYEPSEKHLKWVSDFAMGRALLQEACIVVEDYNFGGNS